MLVRTRHVLSNFLPYWFLISGKPTACLFNSFTHSGHQMKILRDVTAAYLLYRCKYLCMLKFCIVSPSLIKKMYILHVAGYNNKSDNTILLM